MNEITSLLKQLAEQLGTTVDYLWNVLINQAPIHGILNLILFVFTTISIFLLGKYFIWIYNKWTELYDDDKETMHVVLITVFGFLIIIGFIVSIISLPNTLAALFNPEYWALQQVLSLLP